MTHEPRATGSLTETQRTRLDFARRDYKCARGEDLVQLSDAALILLIERLITRLGDVIDLVDDLTRSSSG